MNRLRLIQTLHSIIIADALASPLDTLSAEHIRTVFGTIDDYTDPTPALKNKLHLWKKPALYTALSQYCILLAAINAQQNTYVHQHISNFISTLGDSSHIFRHPQGFLHHLQSPYDAPTAELLICIPALFFLHKQNPNSIIQFILSHNKNAATCAASLFVFMILEKIIQQQLIALDSTILKQTSEDMYQFVHLHSAHFFNNGGNPQNIIDATKDLYDMMINLPLNSDETHFTRYCIPFANRWSKNEYTRLTVNHPFTLLPLALYCLHTGKKESLLYSSIHKGGKISLLTPLVALLATAMYGYQVIPQNLMDNIVNKKRISQLLTSLQNNSLSMSNLLEFFQNEAKLTQKELEEHESKLKHIKSKQTGKNKDKDKYTLMTNHVVESWTKLDKAKWKKERRKK
ncbi:MAG: hypothetical protein WHV26_04175 [Spirochaetota bacterium]